MEETNTIQSANKTLAQTFLWMFLGILSTGIIAAITYYTGAFLDIEGGWTAIAIGQIVIALLFGLCFHKLSPGTVTFLFFLYSMLTRSNIFCYICSILIINNCICFICNISFLWNTSIYWLQNR